MTPFMDGPWGIKTWYVSFGYSVGKSTGNCSHVLKSVRFWARNGDIVLVTIWFQKSANANGYGNGIAMEITTNTDIVLIDRKIGWVRRTLHLSLYWVCSSCPRFVDGLHNIFCHLGWLFEFIIDDMQTTVIRLNWKCLTPLRSLALRHYFYNPK